MLPSRVIICDVGPRDGLQIEPTRVATADKIRLVNGLSQAGLPRIEATSFVSPRHVPQMADAAEVMAGLAQRPPATRLRALAVNGRGAQRAVEAGLHEIAIVAAASETFNLRNAGRLPAEALAEFEQAVDVAKGKGVTVQGVVATAFGCPYEGVVAPEQAMAIADRYAAMGVDELGLADTIGVANPAAVARLAAAVLDRHPGLPLTLHFHNTRGMGLANVLAALQVGVTIFDASIGGLGGCPFAPGATGNISTEDLVHMLNEMGIETGIDLAALLELSAWLERIVGHPLPSAVLKAGRSCKVE